MFKIVTGVSTTSVTLTSLDHTSITFSYTIPVGYKAIGVVGFNGHSWGVAFDEIHVGGAIISCISKNSITISAGQITETILCIKSNFA